jgi:hypothetical protein
MLRAIDDIKRSLKGEMSNAEEERVVEWVRQNASSSGVTANTARPGTLLQMGNDYGGLETEIP